MSATATATATQNVTDTPTLTLRSSANNSNSAQDQEPYRYAALLPVFNNVRYPPLEPFEHVDPGFRALQHPNPRSFLDNATNTFHLTPYLGTEVHGVSLANLTNDERDQLALEASRIV